MVERGVNIDKPPERSTSPDASIVVPDTPGVWYVVFCKPRREVEAETHLARQQYRVYLPRLATQRRHDGRWVDAVEPLFPRYLFVAQRHDQQSLTPVRSTQGVTDFVRFGGQVASVNAPAIAALQMREREELAAPLRRQPFRVGGPVKFAAGSFAGLIGVYDIEAEQERVYVLLEFLGKTNRIKVPRDWIVPVT